MISNPRCSRRSRLVLLTTTLCASACADEELVIAPPSASASAMLLFVGSSVEAVDLTRPTPPTIDGAWGAETLPLTAWVYTKPLSALGLEAGPVSPKACRPCELLEPDLGAFELADARTGGTWAPAAGALHERAPAILADADRCTGCRAFTGRRLELSPPEGGPIAGSTRYSETQTLAVRLSGQLVLIDASGEIRAACTAVPVHALFSAGDAVWTLTASTTLTRYRLSFERGPCPVTGTQRLSGAHPPEAAIAGSPDGSELVVVSAQGGITFVRDGQARQLGTFRDPNPNYPGVAWRAPGDFGAVAGSAEVAIASSTRVEMMPLSGGVVSVSATTIANADEGYLVGTRGFDLLAASTEGVVPFDGGGLTDAIRAVARWRDGLLMVTAGAVLRQRTASGECPSAQSLGIITAKTLQLDAIYPFDAGFIVARTDGPSAALFEAQRLCGE